MPPTPTLQTRYDENGIPVSAKCSMCGMLMPQGQPRITSPIENVAWFAAQFDQHLVANHPPDPRKALHPSSKKKLEQKLT